MKKNSVVTKNIEMSAFQINIQEEKISDVPVWFVLDKDADLVCFSLTFTKAGTAYEEQPGIAKFLASMILEGTSTMDASAFKEYLLNNQIQLYAAAESDNFIFTILTTKENFSKAYQILKQVLSTLRLSGNDLDRIRRELILNYEQALHDPGYVANEEIGQHAFNKNPYFKTTKEIIESIKHSSASLLKQHMDDFFAQDNAQMVFTGGVTKEEIEKSVEDIKSVLAKKRKSTELEKVELIHGGEVVYKQMDIPQSVICFVTPGIARQNPDFYPILLWNGVLGDYSIGSSRLWDEIREKRGLAYYVMSTLVMFDKLHTISGKAGVETKKVDEVINITKQTLQKIFKEGITQEEFELHKKRLMGSYPLYFDSLSDMTNTLTHMMNYGLCVEDVKTRNQKIENLTLAQVNEAAKLHLDPSKITFMVVGRNAHTHS